MLDGAAGLIAHDADKLDQRRTGADIERRGDVGRRQRGADALAGVLDLDAGALEQFEQRARGKFLLGEGHGDAFRHVRRQMRKRHAVERAYAHGALQQRIRPDPERFRDRAFRRHIVERDELGGGAAPHVGQIGEDAGNIRRDRRGRRPEDHPRAGAGPPLDEALTREFAERAAHGDARYAVILRQFVLGRQLGAEAERAADDAVAQHQIDLLCLRLAEPVAQAVKSPKMRQAAAGALLGIL